MPPHKRPLSQHGNDRWEVDFGKDATGTRRRILYETEKEADDAIDAYKKGLKKYGAWWLRLSDLERQQVATTCMAIKTAGKTIGQVWEDWQKWKASNQQSVVEPKVYPLVVEEWERRKLGAGKTKRYVHDARTTVLDKFGMGREKQPIHEIAASELGRWIDARCKHEDFPNDPLRTWGLSSKRTNMSLFSGLWEVAIACGWASQNIVDRLEPVGKLGRVVRIYDNQTVMNLMAASMENEVTQSVIADLSLGFFGCMRPEEITSEKPKNEGLPPEKWFGWHNIDLDHGLVTVSVDVAKTGDQRTIRLQPVAVEWLRLAKKLGNKLPPENERRIVDQICEMIGLEEWIRDGARKNCATHLRAIYRNDYDVVKDCGNSIRILLKHYAALHTPEEISLAHWKIGPDALEAYRKTDAWQQVLVEASNKAAARAEALEKAAAEEEARAAKAETTRIKAPKSRQAR